MKKELSVKKQFNEAILYLKESKKYIYCSILIFLIGILFGIIFKDNLSFLDSKLKELILKSVSLNPLERIFFILQNNLQISIFSIIIGTFFGIFVILICFYNGIVIGYVISKYTASLTDLWRLIPHGIFELPAVFISFGLGIKLGFSLISKNKTFKENLYSSANTLLLVIIPLLIIAAIIEGLLIFFVS
ncbi:MAG: stage II sporulation protein M [Nanoarchaeota archaeon]|mgnify:FL=1